MSGAQVLELRPHDLILERVRRAWELTTVTPRDRRTPVADISGWSTGWSIEEKVERDALALWGKTPNETRIVPPLEVPPPTRFSLVHFVEGILP